MGWYYDNDSVSSYYKWHKEAKMLEKMRKQKEKLEKARQAKLKRETERLLAKKERLERIERERIEKAEKKKQLLEELKQVGYKPTWTKKNPLKRAKNSRDLELCKQIYLKSKEGKSSYELAKEYDMHPNSILRHKYEYEYYLGIKGIDKEIDL